MQEHSKILIEPKKEYGLILKHLLTYNNLKSKAKSYVSTQNYGEIGRIQQEIDSLVTEIRLVQEQISLIHSISEQNKNIDHILDLLDEKICTKSQAKEFIKSLNELLGTPYE